MSSGDLSVGVVVDRFPVLSESFISTLALDLVESGCDLSILPLGGAGDAAAHAYVTRSGLDRRVVDPPGTPSLSALGARIRAAPARAPALAACWLASRVAPGRAAAFRRSLAMPEVDLLHCQFGTLGLAALRWREIGALRSRALVVHLRGHDITTFVAARGPRIYDDLWRKADLVIANCAHFRARAIALGCPADKVVVIGSPIDTDRFAPPPVPREPGRPVRLVAVGRLVEKKGFADAIDAVACLVRDGLDLRLDLLGDGPLRGALEARIAAAGLEARVHLHGAATQEEVIAALHRADIALAPSARAGTGDEDAPVNTLKEAMATELPVVATRHGGIPELVEDGVNGLLVPERDPDALAAAIARLVREPENWRRLGAAGRKKTVENYDRRSILRKTLRAYRQALGQDGDEP